MAGRKTQGPAMVTQLDGSTSAKERLELILATISGEVTVVAAAKQLGIGEAMFYKLRSRVLQVSLEDLEPKMLGRPSRTLSPAEQREAELLGRVQELERELQAQSVRLELAQTMPQVVRSEDGATVKKTNRKAILKRFHAQRKAQARKASRK
jgi:transposase-like protein